MNYIAAEKKWVVIYQWICSGWLAVFEGGADRHRGLLVCAFGQG